jgi:hypothetical protein
MKNDETNVVIIMIIWNKFKIYKLILDRGSLGSWVDEDRSKLRVAMWIAEHMIIDKLNAYCTLYIWFSIIKLH